MPLLATALGRPYAGADVARDNMGPQLFRWLVQLYREDFDARGVPAALARQQLLPPVGPLPYLSASLQEALLLSAVRDVPSVATDWTTPSSDGRLPQDALVALGGVPPSYLPPYVYGVLAAWAHFVDKPSPAWFAEAWLKADEVEFPALMRAWWPGFMAVF